MTKEKINLRLNMIRKTLKQIAKNINHYQVCTGFDDFSDCGQINHKGAKHCIQCNGTNFRDFAEGEIEESIEECGEDYEIEVRNQADSYTSDEFRKMVGEEIK